MEMQQNTKQNANQNTLLDEATRVALLTKAGGMITRNLVKQAEEMLSSGSTPSIK